MLKQAVSNSLHLFFCNSILLFDDYKITLKDTIFIKK